MGLFNDILSKLGFGENKKSEPKTGQANTTEQAGTAAQSTAPSAQDAAAPQAPANAAIGEVDVVAKLDTLARQHPDKLNWTTSIVDLLKLLGLDSSLAARKQMATELGCPAHKMSESSQMNIWLHKTVLQKLADNGGNVPKELLG